MKKIILVHWRNVKLPEKINYMENIEEEAFENIECYMTVPLTHLLLARETFPKFIRLVAPDCIEFDENNEYCSGITIRNLLDIQIKTVILGSAERIFDMNETQNIISQKLICCYKNKLKVILYLINTKEEYETDMEAYNLLVQLTKYFSTLQQNLWNEITVIYEPEWFFIQDYSYFELRLKNKVAYIKKALDIYLITAKIIFSGRLNYIFIKKMLEKKIVDGYLYHGEPFDDDFMNIIRFMNKI
ncbi:triosephosphate isomerase [Hamiltosporidium tvaerminnensis]|uniref:Triosephosphate isomerase n=2 Tax=Hamiltosporidium TaxID=1176354 RepID=A0A4Q9M108_9MICR|nr:triosephosphate isomerase [Hamiltosporidium tvaerminnensis]TBU08631.1 triosephosphate isomerase [Hamiltosporidium magnivora]TBU12592.1 triosephosphate isomerase [Hamiltosporidium tvaerminnensis]TBU15686.1 triosephosphate isomerase [Hamiltosporidium tvaerminnensis]